MMSAADNLDMSSSEMFPCHFAGCKKVFKRKDRLTIHLRVHTGERPFVCEVEDCGKSYSRSQHLSRHVQNTHRLLENEMSTFSCPVCRRDLANTYCLQNHMKAEHEERVGPKRYVCPEADCSQTFHKRKQLVHHRLETHTAHILEARKCHRCPHEGCDRTFKWMNLLKRHMKTHKGYPCQVPGCEKVLPTWSSLRKHTAQDHAPAFTCDECGIQFSRKPNLNQHMKRKHGGPRSTFTCQVEGCGRVYNYKSNLKQHMRECHEGEKIWRDRPRKRTVKKTKKKLSYAAKLCGLDDRGEELKLLKERRKPAPTASNELSCEDEHGKPRDICVNRSEEAMEDCGDMDLDLTGLREPEKDSTHLSPDTHNTGTDKTRPGWEGATNVKHHILATSHSERATSR